jgi:hypothetical protein
VFFEGLMWNRLRTFTGASGKLFWATRVNICLGHLVPTGYCNFVGSPPAVQNMYGWSVTRERWPPLSGYGAVLGSCIAVLHLCVCVCAECFDDANVDAAQSCLMFFP